MNDFGASNSSPSGGTGRSRRGGRRKRRINKKRVAILFFILVMMITVVIVSVMMVHASKKPKEQSSTDKEPALFGVSSILVDGNTHYTDDQIIETSGLYIGQSLFFVNKRSAAESILKNFPYIDKVTIKNASFSQISITVSEAKPVGIVKWQKDWLIIGDNGKGLELLNQDSSRLPEYEKIDCDTLKNGGVGCLTIDNRTQDIINTMTYFFNHTNLKDVNEIDLKNYNDLSMNWKNAIEIKLGSDVLLREKLDFASITLNRTLKEHGESAEGRIDLRYYSEAKQKAIFTPRDLITDATDSANSSGITESASAE